MRRRRAWTSPNNYRRAFVRHTDPASQRVRTVSTRVGANLKPVDLVLTGDHPRGRVGRMMGLVHIVRSVHINVGGIRIHQDTTAVGRRSRSTQGRAEILIMFQHYLFVGTGDEIARRELRYSGLLRPLAPGPRQTPGEAGSA